MLCISEYRLAPDYLNLSSPSYERTLGFAAYREKGGDELKRMILIMAIALVTVAMMAVPAFAQGNSGAAHYCRYIAGSPPYFPPGACVSYFAHNK